MSDSMQENYAGDYLQESSLLQRAAEPSCEEPAAQEIDGEEEQKAVQELPVEDKRIASNRLARSTTTAGQEVDIQPLVETTPPEPEDLALLAEIEEVLDPGTGKWWGAKHVARTPQHFKPHQLAECLADEADLPEYKGRAEELLPVVRYLMSARGTAA